ncbi:MAG: hypothetical protein ACR2HG_11165 [Pyrinomonadaceae bacterium]
MKKTNVTALFAVFAILAVGLACNRMQTGKTTVEKTPADNSNSASSETTKTPTTAPKDISGAYDVSGTNENGAGNFKGTLNVTKRDKVYEFSWDTAGKKFDGVGVQNDSAVAVAFTEGNDGKGCGVVLYKINADGSLDGKAGYWGVNESETEKAMRASGSGLVGEYDVKGTNTEGKDYTTKLSVKEEGAGYAFSWTGADALQGFGIKQGDNVAVGFGGKQCGFVSYIVKPDGTLDGKWGGYGSTSVGTETDKKK